MGLIVRIVPVFIGWVIWQKSGSIIIGAFVAVIIESVLGAFLPKQ